MPVSADHAGHDVAYAHAVTHLIERGLLVAAGRGKRRVRIGRVLRRELNGRHLDRRILLGCVRLRKTRHRDTARVGWMFTFVAAAYNLVRLPKLLAKTA